MKHKACPSSLISVLPAERRTTALGITIRVVATIRTISQIDMVSCSSNGVPSTATSALMGTDLGCGFILAKVTNIPHLSSTDSPIPTIPPEHTLMPAFEAFSIVLILSS